MLEIIRSCPLRGCFEFSPGYERRIGYAARIGTAVHQTIESLAKYPPTGANLEQRIEETRHRFADKMTIQDAEKAAHPCEQWLPKDEHRLDLAFEHLLKEVLRLSAIPDISEVDYVSINEEPNLPIQQEQIEQETPLPVTIESEVSVQSQDGKFIGRIDLIEHLAEGVVLYDYKFAARNDLPDRYVRQIQFYALLFYETRGVWPIRAQIIYPLVNTTYDIDINPTVCQQVGQESESLLDTMQKTKALEQLATPGEVCQICEFRPWCNSFWNWQSREKVQIAALQRASLGFEGEVASISLKDGHWKMLIYWRQMTIRLVAPMERFLHLHFIHEGMHVRVIDTHVHGSPMYMQARVTDKSEIYFIDDE